MALKRGIALITTVFLLGVACSTAGHAMEVTMDGYIKYGRNKGPGQDFILNWLDGVFRGMEWANAVSKQQNGEALFCSPAKMAMTVEQVKSILDNYMDKHPFQAKDSVGLTLLLALEEVFPCPR
jgi:hypothetical protein